MKIEKLNDRQIRCTLTKADLADRQLKLSELAYGTEKAKALFRDMVRQASLKFGFEAEDIPLMIEAVPLNSDCIVLIITKVEDPEELDTRFSRFAPSVMEQDGDDEDDENPDILDHMPDSSEASAISGDILNLFNKIKQEAANLIGGGNVDVNVSVSEVSNEAPTEKKNDNVAKIFSFASIHEILTPAKALENLYDGVNTLYKDKKNNRFILVLSNGDENREAFNKACNIISEYGKLERLTSVSSSYFEEHLEVVIADEALQKLALV